MARWIGTVVLALLAAFWVIGLDPMESDVPGDPAAQHALTAVTTAQFDREHPVASFPTDYRTVMRYLPATAIGPNGTPILIKPTGDCSSPTGPTRFDFSTVCKEHDLSYDVIRYAGLIGHPLPPAARQAADAMFDRELHGRCDERQVSGIDALLCHTYAESFAVVVKINSWRQGYRPPGQESSLKWTSFLLLTMALVAFRAVWAQMPVSAARTRLGWPPDQLLLPDKLTQTSQSMAQSNTSPSVSLS